MRKVVSAFAFASLVFFLPAPAGRCIGAKTKTVIPLSLKRAVSYAFRNNKDIQIQEKEIDAAKAGIMDARSAFLPKVNVNTGYTHNDAVLVIDSPPGAEFKKDIGIFTGYKNDLQLGASVDESVYSGGASVAALNQSILSYKVQEVTLRAKKLAVEFEAKRLYYGLLLAHDILRINRDLVMQARLHYKDVANRFEQGTSSRFDLLQSKVHYSKQIPGYVKAKGDVDLITADLKKLLGLKMGDTIKIQGRLDYSRIEIDEESFLKAAYSKNPEMVLKLLGIDIGRWSVEMARSGFRPRIDASMGVLYRSDDPGDMFNSRHDNWNVGVTVKIPVFDGYSTRAKVEAAKARYAQAVLGKEDLSDQIAVDIRRACLDLAKAEAIINSQRDNVLEAKEALKISRISYDNGVGTNLDVMDAQVSLSEIEKNLSEGIYDYLMAKAFLERTIGEEFLAARGGEE